MSHAFELPPSHCWLWCVLCYPLVRFLIFISRAQDSCSCIWFLYRKDGMRPRGPCFVNLATIIKSGCLANFSILGKCLFLCMFTQSTHRWLTIFPWFFRCICLLTCDGITFSQYIAGFFFEHLVVVDWATLTIKHFKRELGGRVSGNNCSSFLWIFFNLFIFHAFGHTIYDPIYCYWLFFVRIIGISL